MPIWYFCTASYSTSCFIQLVHVCNKKCLFSCLLVASQVVARSPFTFQSHTLNVILAPPKPNPDPFSIKVSGFKNTSTKDVIEMFFESKKRSDGGEIKTSTLNSEQGSAVITFEKESKSIHLFVNVYLNYNSCEEN